MTYNTKVYREQGGDDLKIASGGSIEAESGSTIDGSAATTRISMPDSGTLHESAPTQAQLVTVCGDASQGKGSVKIITNGTQVYLAASDGDDWYYVQLTVGGS